MHSTKIIRRQGRQQIAGRLRSGTHKVPIVQWPYNRCRAAHFRRCQTRRIVSDITETCLREDVKELEHGAKADTQQKRPKEGRQERRWIGT